MKTIVLFCLLILVPGIALAAAGTKAVADLYTGEAVVSDQSAAERERALPLALAQVLSKLSGLPHFEDRPLVGPALERAPAILLSYHYRNVERPGTDGGEGSEQRLFARFSRPDIDALARALQLPVWRYDRSAVVVWLVVDEGDARRIMPVEFADDVEAMSEAAAGRGLPVEWPEPISGTATEASTEVAAGAGVDANQETGADADPRLALAAVEEPAEETAEAPIDTEGAGKTYAVDPQLLWGGYTEDLATPDGKGAMIVAARREGPEWAVRINLSYKGRHWAWRLQDIDLRAALVTAMHQTVDQVAEANSIAAADLGSWEQDLTVAGLRGAGDYQRCLAYLQGLNIVESVAVVSARPGVATFRLALQALPQYLDESLATDGVLSWVEAEGRYLLAEANPDER